MKHHSSPVPCPRCGKKRESRRGSCEHCGYDGYVPMSEEQIKQTKLILYPIFAVVAALAILMIFWINK